MSLHCPICSNHMDCHTDPGDPEHGYTGGEERFRCSSDRCELGAGWLDADEVSAVVEAHVHVEQAREDAA